MLFAFLQTLLLAFLQMVHVMVQGIFVFPLQYVFQHGPVLYGNAFQFMGGLSFAEYCAREKETSVAIWTHGPAFEECVVFVERKQKAFVISFYALLVFYAFVKIMSFVGDYTYMVFIVKPLVRSHLQLKS